jgi:hypothetical protein
MNRATLVYVVMAACLVAGLWAILGFGSTLRAAPDLAGAWQIEPDARALVATAATPLGRSFSLEQSGRFVRLQFERGTVVDLKITENRPVGGPKGQPRRAIQLNGSGWALAATGDPASDEMRMDLLGPVSVAFTARRTQHTYPSRTPHHPPATPPASRPAVGAASAR